MPQYLISVWHDETFELDFSTPDAQRRVAQVDGFNNELQQAGAWVFAAGLHPASSATVVRSSGGDVSMTDGPYAETKEQMGGYDVIEARDLRLLTTQLFGKTLRVGDGVLQIVLSVRIFIDAHRNEPRRTRAPEAVGAGQDEVSVFALDVVFVEGVGGQTVRSRKDGDFFFHCGGRLSF